MGSNQQRLTLIDAEGVIQKAFADLNMLVMNEIIGNQYPRVFYCFPDWPSDADQKFLYGGLRNQKSKVFKVEKPAPKKKDTKVIETSTPVTKRNSRYKGKYDDNNLEKFRTLSSAQSDVNVGKPPQTSNKAQQSKNRTSLPLNNEKVHKAIPKLQSKSAQQHKKTRTLSDSSSSESETEVVEDEKAKFFKLMDMKEVPKNSTVLIGVKISPESSNIDLLKESFENKSFDEAMKVYAQKKKEILPPPIIPAPEFDPSQKRKAKKRKIVPEKVHPDAHLGGIFLINNGWDKPIPKKELPRMIPREERFLPPITLVNKNLLHHQEEYTNELNEMSEIIVMPKRKRQSIFDSDDEEGENETVAQIEPVELENNMGIDNVDVSSPGGCDDYDDDGLLFCNDDNLDDLLDDDDDDVKDPKVNVKRKFSEVNIVTELDDTCLKITLERPKTPEEQPASPKVAKIEEIFAVDPETDEIIIKIFGGACPGFLDYRCKNTKCARNHMLQKQHSKVFEDISKLSANELENTNKVLARFHCLFKEYVSAFAHLYGIRKNEKAIIQLIKDSESHPRLTSCYRVIVNHLVQSNFASPVMAISFLIQHHNFEYAPSRDVILNIIVEMAGPQIGMFNGYIAHVMTKQNVPLETFKKIVALCNDYQAQTFPILCLNYMMTMSAKDLADLGDQNISKFLSNQNSFCRSFDQKAIEAKLMFLLEKLKSSNQQAINTKKAFQQPYQVFK